MQACAAGRAAAWQRNRRSSSFAAGFSRTRRQSAAWLQQLDFKRGRGVPGAGSPRARPASRPGRASWHPQCEFGSHATVLVQYLYLPRYGHTSIIPTTVVEPLSAGRRCRKRPGLARVPVCVCCATKIDKPPSWCELTWPQMRSASSHCDGLPFLLRPHERSSIISADRPGRPAK
eukprot:COSAG04_NODE_3839_length_2484_cov_2.236897_2_plen_175_part_00